MSESNNSDRLVSCSFCSEQFSRSEIGEHLMTCGNKTDQCPNCRRYIRRAIFAYHFGNNCANLDEGDVKSNGASAKSVVSTTIEPTNRSQYSPQEGAYSFGRTFTSTVYLSGNSKPVPKYSNTGSFLITSLCLYCKYECELSDMEKHREVCVQNPKNIARRRQSKTSEASNPSSVLGQPQHSNQSDETALIPCELCREPIEWHHFEEHKDACVIADRERRENRLRASNQSSNNHIARCKYCNEERSIASLQFHESVCFKRNNIDNRTYLSSYNLQPAYNGSTSFN